MPYGRSARLACFCKNIEVSVLQCCSAVVGKARRSDSARYVGSSRLHVLSELLKITFLGSS